MAAGLILSSVVRKRRSLRAIYSNIGQSKKKPVWDVAIKAHHIVYSIQGKPFFPIKNCLPTNQKGPCFPFLVLSYWFLSLSLALPTKKLMRASFVSSQGIQ